MKFPYIIGCSLLLCGCAATLDDAKDFLSEQEKSGNILKKYLAYNQSIHDLQKISWQTGRNIYGLSETQCTSINHERAVQLHRKANFDSLKKYMDDLGALIDVKERDKATEFLTGVITNGAAMKVAGVVPAFSAGATAFKNLVDIFTEIDNAKRAIEIGKIARKNHGRIEKVVSDLKAGLAPIDNDGIVALKSWEMCENAKVEMLKARSDVSPLDAETVFIRFGEMKRALTEREAGSYKALPAALDGLVATHQKIITISEADLLSASAEIKDATNKVSSLSSP